MDLVNNFIGAKGVKYLARAEWPVLQEINVGTSNFIKDTTTLESREPCIFPELNGRV
jgi:hypothetical protein